jgi:hypothetical protein
MSQAQRPVRVRTLDVEGQPMRCVGTNDGHGYGCVTARRSGATDRAGQRRVVR